MRTYLIVVILGVSLIACSNPMNQPEVSETNTFQETSFFFKPKITYSRYFTIDVRENYKTVIVKNPWSTNDTLVSYVLYPKGKSVPSIQWAEFKIPVPIEKVVATSSPHIGNLKLIEELDQIIGVADDRYLFNPYIYEKVVQGEISQVGSLKDSNLEVLLDLSPDLVMKTGVDNVRNEDVRLIEAEIPVSYNVEWMETDMLARAEWIKFIATFFNKDEMADSIFRQVEKDYLSTISITKNIKERPSVMTGNNFKGTWYMPSADSYLTKLILDAGGDYQYKNKKSTGSLPISFEVVLDDLIEADFWIGPRAESLKGLGSQDERYALFKPFQEGNVYTFNKRVSQNGGNDYWESGMARPDLILKDVTRILHPELMPNHQLYYYKKLQ